MRDPRTDPRPGDVLLKQGKTRELRRKVDEVRYTGRGELAEVFYNGRRLSAWCGTWLAWAVGTDIVKRGVE